MAAHKYKINEDPAGGDKFEVDADQFSLRDGYFSFYVESGLDSDEVFVIQQSLVFTITQVS